MAKWVKGMESDRRVKPKKSALLKAFEAAMAGPASEDDGELLKMVRGWKDGDASKFLAEYNKAEALYSRRMEAWEAAERERKKRNLADHRGRKKAPLDGSTVKVVDVIQKLLKKIDRDSTRQAGGLSGTSEGTSDALAGS